MSNKIAIIIGGGPAGLTTAYELLHRTDIKPIIFESNDDVGGICRTVNYKGNRIDIGGHRFFTKSDRINRWWLNIMPVQGIPSEDAFITGGLSEAKKDDTIYFDPNGPDPTKTDKVMLIRKRLSRIYFLRKFFDYPLSLNAGTVRKLGLVRFIRIIYSYGLFKLFPIKPEVSFRDFIINRFGKELYFTFFKAYTEKVWGVPCRRIKAEWGAQRIKGLSLSKAIRSSIKKIFSKDSSINQKGTETSLIERFMYPKFGPGQIWDEVARIVEEKGGVIHKNYRVFSVVHNSKCVTKVRALHSHTGEEKELDADYVFSTMPVKDLIASMNDVPEEATRIAKGLVYRDFITVGVLLKRMNALEGSTSHTKNGIPPDNWIYIQEQDVKVGRLQIFNNWSPYLVKDPNTIWIGMEYFCNEGDELWVKDDNEVSALAIAELEKMNMCSKEDVLDHTVIRVPKTYPAYFGTYDQFSVIRNFTDQLENLFLIGRNGMHRYNNQDHSMLAAMVAVDNIIAGKKTKANIWSVNTEQTYHEEK